MLHDLKLTKEDCPTTDEAKRRLCEPTPFGQPSHHCCLPWWPCGRTYPTLSLALPGSLLTLDSPTGMHWCECTSTSNVLLTHGGHPRPTDVWVLRRELGHHRYRRAPPDLHRLMSLPLRSCNSLAYSLLEALPVVYGR
jgi:hypothetical protein